MQPNTTDDTLSAFYQHLASFNPSNPVIMDLVHVQFICGTIFALKPRNVLEIGIGSGFLSRAMLRALACNKLGSLTCVDNAYDWCGTPPPHFDELSTLGAQIILSDEASFLQSARGEFDLIVCDGDHRNSDKNASHVFALAADNAFVFFHDTSNPDFPNLLNLTITARHSGFDHYEFTRVSLPLERTNRGLLMVINRRANKWHSTPVVKVSQVLTRIHRKIHNEVLPRIRRKIRKMRNL